MIAKSCFLLTKAHTANRWSFYEGNDRPAYFEEACSLLSLVIRREFERWYRCNSCDVSGANFYACRCGRVVKEAIKDNASFYNGRHDAYTLCSLDPIDRAKRYHWRELAKSSIKLPGMSLPVES